MHEVAGSTPVPPTIRPAFAGSWQAKLEVGLRQKVGSSIILQTHRVMNVSQFTIIPLRLHGIKFSIGYTLKIPGGI